MTRPISTIAREIAADWHKPFYAAAPYLRAMHNLDTVNDTYGIDYARIRRDHRASSRDVHPAGPTGGR
jgi:hypothetical protein